MDYRYIFTRSDGLKLICIKIDLFLTNMQLFAYWSGVDYFFLISYLDSHSDGTHSLQRIHW